jgi:predicted RNA-binding protein with PUA-like domain
MPARHYWLVKSEADVFSFDDLLAAPNQTTGWDGVRNYAARNHLRSMRSGDHVLFYYSMDNDKAVVGVAEVVREAYPDATALDSADAHFDPKSNAAIPTWFMVDLKAVERLPRPVRLDEIKRAKGLEKMALLRIGRLSVQPVTDDEYAIVRALADAPASAARPERAAPKTKRPTRRAAKKVKKSANKTAKKVAKKVAQRPAR